MSPRPHKMLKRCAMLAASAPLLLVGGCALFAVRDPAPVPARPTPPPDKPFYDANPTPSPSQQVAEPGVRLNKPPVVFRAVRVEVEPDGAPILYVQRVTVNPNAAPTPTPLPTATPLPGATPRATARPARGGTPQPGNVSAPADPVRLAGVLLPTAEPFRVAALQTLQGWTAGQDLDLEQDKVFPFDLKGHARMQVLFKGRSGPTKGVSLSLNRLMVRSGFAVVDLYSPTAFDTGTWLKDESVAQGQSNNNPVGLWKYPGFAIARRVSPTPTPKPKPAATPAAGAARGSSATRSTTTTTTTTTRSSSAAAPDARSR